MVVRAGRPARLASAAREAAIWARYTGRGPANVVTVRLQRRSIPTSELKPRAHLGSNERSLTGVVGYLSEEQLKALLNTALAIEKEAYGNWRWMRR